METYKTKVKYNKSRYSFCSGRVSKEFTKNEQSKIFLSCTAFDFSVEHISIKKEDILNIHQYLLIKNNMK